ncbi:hypothetical protein HDU98_002178 [Podochytrium sp. JEL0797]|nr:hypothetical protein HDU98_002178 [Podochytrium sp. JEL0797]
MQHDPVIEIEESDHQSTRAEKDDTSLRSQHLNLKSVVEEFVERNKDPSASNYSVGYRSNKSAPADSTYSFDTRNVVGYADSNASIATTGAPNLNPALRALTNALQTPG